MCYSNPRGFPVGSVLKNQPALAGDTRDSGLIPGSARSARSPGEGNIYPLQYSGLDNSVYCISMRSQRVRNNYFTDQELDIKRSKSLV